VEILLNDQPLDFTLEGERTLGEVVVGLERWLQGSSLVLYSVRHDGRELLGLPAEQWAGTPQSEVGRLEVTVRQTGELARANLRTAAEFLALARGFASGAEADPALAAELSRGLAPLAESLRRHFPPEEVEAGLAGLSALLDRADPADRDMSGGKEAASGLQELEQRVARRLQELEDPRLALERLAGELEPCLARAAELSLLLQTGRDREAMELIVRFTELSQALVRLLDSAALPAIDGREPGEYFGELNRMLKELAQAFEAKDTVLIGDLMEYEIVPRLRRLQEALA
jgi:hypothetical protein